MRPMALILLQLTFWTGPASAARVKDIASVYGVRDNLLFGYGLVTGLDRSGDSRRNEATIRALANRLQGLGFTLEPTDILSRNVAVVMVTANMPASGRPGHRLDVQVSSAGDATSLEGGVLQLTPLFASDGQVFASAHGSLVIGGFSVEGGGSRTAKNHSTVGKVPQGATVERENPDRVDLERLSEVDWIVREPDFTTATRMAGVVNTAFGQSIAAARDGGMVSVLVPEDYKTRVIDFVAKVESLDVQVDSPARVVINERTGTVVMGAEVRISPVAVAHGGLSIQVHRRPEVSQPAPFSLGQTAITEETGIRVEESGGDLVMVEGTTIGDLVGALNDMGVKPRDLIQILITIRAAGAMQAELEVL